MEHQTADQLPRFSSRRGREGLRLRQLGQPDDCARLEHIDTSTKRSTKKNISSAKIQRYSHCKEKAWGRRALVHKEISFEDLPEEMLIEIFSHLDTWTKGSVSQVCRKFYDAAACPRVWQNAIVPVRNPAFVYSYGGYVHAPIRKLYGAQYLDTAIRDFIDVCSIRRIKLIGPNLLRDPEHFLQLAAEVPQLSYLHVYNGVIGAAALHTIASNFPFLDHLVLDGGEWKASDFTNVAACLRMSSVRQLTLINQTLLVDRTVNGMLRAYFADAIDGENHQGDVSGRLTVVRLQQCPRLTRTGVQSRPCVAVIHVRRHGGGDGVTPHSARRPFRPVGVGCVSPDNTTDWPTLTALAARTTALPSPVGSDTRDKTGCPATPAAAANTDWSLIS
eukprot:m.338197 g.338197  ORF g.338197 m.338197 type:complete len:389 (+) comp20557_c0_seq33:209-1375(+)